MRNAYSKHCSSCRRIIDGNQPFVLCYHNLSGHVQSEPGMTLVSLARSPQTEDVLPLIGRYAGTLVRYLEHYFQPVP